MDRVGLQSQQPPRGETWAIISSFSVQFLIVSMELHFFDRNFKYCMNDKS